MGGWAKNIYIWNVNIGQYLQLFQIKTHKSKKFEAWEFA